MFRADAIGRAALAVVVAALVLPAQAQQRRAEVVDIELPRNIECLPADLQRDWDPIEDDRLHAAQLDGVDVLQDPADALAGLPIDSVGNQVDWIEAKRAGLIAPRASLDESSVEVRLRDTKILMQNTGSSPYVLFPHRPHTEWLDCENCHQGMFAESPGATQMSMMGILQGMACGRCHGAISFPLTECYRCHTISARTLEPVKYCKREDEPAHE